MPVAYAGTDLSLVLAERIGLHTMSAHYRAAHVKPQFTSPETVCHVMQEGFYLLLVEVHQYPLHDEDKFCFGMLPAQVIHPVGLQQRRFNIDIVRLFGYQFPA